MPTEKRFGRRFGRMDFKLEIVNYDEKTGKCEVILIPHPERYELRTIDGEKGYYDKFDNAFIPLDELEKAIPQLDGMPIYYSPPKIEDANRYISERIPHIKEFFQTKTIVYEFKDLSEEYLKKLEKDKMRFVILSLDLKGSTKLSQELSDETYSDIISLFLREMTFVVDKFNGYILKSLGDGLIAYFPEPNFVGMNDNALDCAVTMKKMIIFGMNPILKENKLPELNFRIGLDSGEAIIKIIGVESIKIHKDLIGETVSLAAKIEKLANANQILMGESTALALHTFWRKKIRRFSIPQEWDYKNRETGKTYPVYYLIENW